MKMSLPRRPNAVGATGFYRDDSLDFSTRLMLGRASSGASDVGEVLMTVAGIDKQAQWAAQWTATARRLERQADEARAAEHRVTAFDKYLRASSYWAAVVDGLTTVDRPDDLLAAFRAHRRCWDAVVDCSGGAFERVAVPYGDIMLPGFLLRPDASGQPRPTLVMTNGSDGAISDMWSTGAAGALKRGWNAFVYDGPGQQSLLFEHLVPFRPDWEAVLTPVVDTLVDRPDVDPTALAAYGISQAGYWVARALAFEHRFAAAVLDPGVVDVSTSWTSPLSAGMRKSLATSDRKSFTRNMNLALKIPSIRRTLTFRSRPYQIVDWFDLYRELERYRIDKAIAAAIRTPVLIADPEREQFWPGQPQQLADMIGSSAELVAFTEAEGAAFHCQPMGRLLTDERMFDWLESKVGASAGAAASRVPS
jgi:hypothetical protein